MFDKTPPSERKAPRQYGCGSLVAVILALVVGGCVYGMINGDSVSTTTGRQQGSAGGGVGLDTVLQRNGSTEISVARDKESLDALVKAAVAGDEYGFNELFAQDRAFSVENGTKVRTIDRTVTTFQVRILEGNHQSESGWVPVEYVQR